MVDYYVYAWDSSSLISENENGYCKRLKTILQFMADMTKIKEEQVVAGEPSKQAQIICLHWSRDFREAFKEKTKSEYFNRIGKWAEREPEWIIKSLKDKYILDANHKIKLLYIISDHKYIKTTTKKLIELNKNMHYEKVVFHAFHDDLAEIDLSIAAPFFKKHCDIYYNHELCYSADISKKFNYDEINADNFAAKKDQLKSYIKLKYINKFKLDTDVWQEIDKLTMLRNRLLEELLLKTRQYIFSPVNLKATERNLPTRGPDFMNYWEFFNAVVVIRTDVNESFAAMLEYLKSNKKYYLFDALRFNAKVDKPVVEEPMDDADSTDDDADSTGIDTDSSDNDADSIDNDADSMDDDADSMDDDADSMDDDADSTDDDADSIDDDADSMDDDDANSNDDDDAESTVDKETKFLDYLLEHKDGISIWDKYLDIKYS